MNETRMLSSENQSYTQLFQQKSFIRLLDEEKSSFSENKFNFLPNIESSFKPKSDIEFKKDNKNESESNIILINKDASENTSKNGKNATASEKNKRDKNNFEESNYSKKYNLDDKYLIYIENQKVNDSRDNKGDSDNMLSFLEKDLEDDLLIIDEEAYNEKFKSVNFL